MRQVRAQNPGIRKAVVRTESLAPYDNMDPHDRTHHVIPAELDPTNPQNRGLVTKIERQTRRDMSGIADLAQRELDLRFTAAGRPDTIVDLDARFDQGTDVAKDSWQHNKEALKYLRAGYVTEGLQAQVQADMAKRAKRSVSSLQITKQNAEAEAESKPNREKTTIELDNVDSQSDEIPEQFQGI